MRRNFLHTVLTSVLGILLAAFAIFFAADALGEESALLSVSASLTETDIVKGENIILECSIQNNSESMYIIDNYGDYLKNKIAVFVKDRFSGALLSTKSGASYELHNPVTVRPGVSATVSIDLNKIYDLSRDGQYLVKVVAFRGEATAASSFTSFRIISGIQISSVERGISTIPGRAFNFSLVYWERSRKEQLFLRITDSQRPQIPLSLISLGAFLRVTEPEIVFTGNDELEITQQVTRDRFCKTRIGYATLPPSILIRDANLISEDAVNEEINARLISDHLNDVEKNPPAKKKKGLFSRH